MVQFQYLIVSALVAASAAVTSLTASGEPKMISDFSGPNPLKMNTVNDPVMGGESYSTAAVKDGGLVWEGELKIVKKLKAPGFCVLETENFASGSLLTGGSDLCFLIDPKKSTLLEKLQVSISAGGWSSSLRSDKRQGRRGGNMGTSYNAILKVSDTKRADSLQEYCAALNVDTFKAQKMWYKTKSTSPPMDNAFLAKVSKIRLSWGGEEKKAGKFSVKITSIYVIDDSDIELSA